MGNCVHKPVTWLDDDDDDDEPWSPEYNYQENIRLVHHVKPKSKDVFVDVNSLPHGIKGKEVRTAGVPATEIKIRISRKQLEELLLPPQNVDGSTSSLQKVLLDLVSLGKASGLQEQHGGRHWRPNLLSIPEAAE